MLRFCTALLLLAAALTAGKPKTTGPAKNENQSVAITASLILDREEIKLLVGSDLDGHYILVNLTVTPKFGATVDVRRDDFILKTDKDGERATPWAPSQIAGKGALVVTQKSASASTGGGQFGSPYDYPAYGGGVGGAPTMITEAQGKMQNGAKGDTPLMKTLNDKILPEKKSEAPVSGLLYFPMEKQKQKDLELWYNTPDGKLILRFR
jgi:hypothetical protein